MVNWKDLTDVNRKLDAAIRDDVIHVVKPIPDGLLARCGEVFDYAELLVLRQRLEDIGCPECFEIAKDRLEHPENYHREGAAVPGGRKFKDGCWRHPVCKSCPFPDCIAREYECV